MFCAYIQSKPKASPKQARSNGQGAGRNHYLERESIMSSQPIYLERPSDRPASHRLVVLQQAVPTQLLSELTGKPEPLRILCLGRQQALGAAQPECCASLDALQERLAGLLSQAPMGTRLYVFGDEAFVWHIFRLAQPSGLLQDEIELIALGSRRRLYCVHCATLQDVDGAEAEHDCSACGLRLEVRGHFSRRLGAYLGACLDPIDPHGGAGRQSSR